MTKESFLSNADVLDDESCWNWLRGIEGHGYGMAWYKGKSVKAHRVSWILHHGDIPEWNGYQEGVCVLHKCDNPACVNPSHLFLGSHSINMMDRSMKDRVAHQNGAVHGMAKLNDVDIMAIRSDRRRGVDIAKTYGVSQAIISMIKSRKRWNHLP